MTLLARRREEVARAQTPHATAEKTRSVASRPPRARPGFLHLQAALGNRATSELLLASAATSERRDGPLDAEGAASLDLRGAAADPQLELVARLLHAPRPPLLVADASAARRGQMSRGDFLVAMRDAARAAAEDALTGTGHRARDCPWIEHYFRFYQQRSAERIEADLYRYVPAARAAVDAGELLALGAAQVGASVRHWAQTGELRGVPRGLPGTGLLRAVTGSAAAATEIQAQLGAGKPLETTARSRMERVFGRRFAAVRLHTGVTAARLAQRFRARAFAVGPHIAFDRGEYRPGTPIGDALLAHELAHVAQQDGASAPAPSSYAGDAASPAVERDADLAAEGAVTQLWAAGRGAAAARPRRRVGLQLAACPKKKVPAPTEDQKIDSVEEAARRLTATAGQVDSIVAGARLSLAKAENRQALAFLNQARVGKWLAQTRALYGDFALLVAADVAAETRLRGAYVKALDAIRKAASTGLAAAEGADAATAERERKAYAENVVAWIEASPFTSTGLASTQKFEQADVEVARAYEAALEAYLDQLLVDLPKLKLTQPERDRINAQLLAALRRAYVTIAKGANDRIDVRAIREPRIAEKYHEVQAFLVEGSRGPKMEVITADVDLTLYKFDIASIKADLERNPRIGKIDVRRVPADEVDYVYYGLWNVERTTLLGVTNQAATLKNAVWPLTMPVRRGGKEVKVRYELIFDQHANVRVERLGEVRGDEVPAAFRKLGVADKKAALVKEFGLSGLDDRPPSPPRPETKWSSDELDKLKGALDRLPPSERSILQGVALVRDFKHPTKPEEFGGIFHSAEAQHLDEPGPPAHPPPHIHYYEGAFQRHKFTAVGAPGAAGPGVEQTFLHEIGHLRIGVLRIRSTAAINAANQRITAADQALSTAFAGTPVSKPQADAWKAWIAARDNVGTAISAYADAVVEFGSKSETAKKTNDPFPDPATLAPLLAAAQTAIQDSAVKRKELEKRGVTLKMRNAAAERDAAAADQLKAWQQAVAQDRQIPIFATLANRFGFHPFTDYARKGGEEEWFAETYSLWVTDPDRLNTMSPKLFQWFQAGMPQDESWQPPKKP